MTQTSIPCLFMRAGTSRGPFFDAADLPADTESRDRILLAAMGSSADGRQIDGIGGGDPLTSKVAIVAKSERVGVDVEYTFAQVATDRASVDVGPSCGNMLAGVGPFAIETGMVPAADGETVVRILDRNTGARIVARVHTPGGQVAYAGDTVIDGVAGAGAPIRLEFTEVVGSKTGALAPTGVVAEEIDGLTVSCIDVATPMLLIRAADLGLTGKETPAALDARKDLFARVEAMRIEAGRRMGLGDVTDKVIPKVGLLSAASAGGAIASRYLTPWRAHAAHAVTGAICVAAAARIPGTVASALVDTAGGDVAGSDVVGVEHPSGQVAIAFERSAEDGGVGRAGVVRTARLLMRGGVMVPSALRAAATPAAVRMSEAA